MSIWTMGAIVEGMPPPDPTQLPSVAKCMPRRWGVEAKSAENTQMGRAHHLVRATVRDGLVDSDEVRSLVVSIFLQGVLRQSVPGGTLGLWVSRAYGW